MIQRRICHSFGAGFGSRPFFKGSCGVGGVLTRLRSVRSKAASSGLSSSGGLSVMAKSPLIDWSPPEEYARSYRLVGEFMFYWAALEAELNRGVRKLLGLEGTEGIIATANMQVRDKIHTLRTLVTYYASSDADALKAHNKTIDRIGDMAGQRNLVAHNIFAPHDDGGVEFFLIKAKGKFAAPETVWSIEDFLNKNHEMTQLAEALNGIVAATASHQRLIKAVMRNQRPMTNAFSALSTPDNVAPNLLNLLDPPPPVGPHSANATPEKAPRKLRERKPKREKKKPQG